MLHNNVSNFFLDEHTSGSWSKSVSHCQIYTKRTDVDESICERNDIHCEKKIAIFSSNSYLKLKPSRILKKKKTFEVLNLNETDSFSINNILVAVSVLKFGKIVR